ncbi:MAG: SseB family protein, partial [Eubacterium sp.]|nr:SseB family protein [Eubacterium sp.]
MSSNKTPLIKPKAVPNVGPAANKAANAANQQQPQQQQITNPILCKAMDVFKADPSANTQAAFIQQLFKSRLLIPCNALKKTEKEGKTEVQLPFLTLKNKDGENL